MIMLLDSNGLGVFIKMSYQEVMKCVLMYFQMMEQMGNMVYTHKGLLVKAGLKHGIHKEVLMVLLLQTLLLDIQDITIWIVASGNIIFGIAIVTDVE
jgi:hypothetical protein